MKGEDTIRAADSGKPDPSEPWRYGCPGCGSSNVRTHSGRIARSSTRKRAHYHRDTERVPHIECRACGDLHDFVLDRKTDQRKRLESV